MAVTFCLQWEDSAVDKQAVELNGAQIDNCIV